MDMLDSMVAAVATPDAVHRKLEALGPAHTRHGARALEHMPVFQRALGRLLLDGLGEAGLTDEVLCVCVCVGGVMLAGRWAWPLGRRARVRAFA